MPSGTLCEPVDLPPGSLLRAERIAHGTDQLAPDRFAHFHDAAELLWFEAVDGDVITQDGTFPITSGTAVLIPSMRHHDFVIGRGSHRWTLIHLEPSMLATLCHPGASATLGQCLVVPFEGAARTRMRLLFDWLVELSSAGDGRQLMLTRVAELIILELAARPLPTRGPANGKAERLDRLRPALNLVARNPASPPTLEGAASACHLSTAYFSRRFKLTFETNFSDYVRGYRLRLAAQRLLSGGERVGDIAYDLGFATPAHFTALFQKRYGVSPSTYRSRSRAQIQDTN